MAAAVESMGLIRAFGRSVGTAGLRFVDSFVDRTLVSRTFRARRYGRFTSGQAGRTVDGTLRRADRLCGQPSVGGRVRPYHRRMTFDRITVDPDLMGGAPTVRGLRIPVATVVSMVADGMTVDEICADLPDLTPDDVAEALRFAAETVRERRLPLRPSA